MTDSVDRIPSGIPGFDALIGGGFVKNTVSVIYGSPGVGKSIFAMQFLREGLKTGEKAFYISLEQTRESLLRQADSLGFSEFRENLVFAKMTGHDFKSFLSTELPKILSMRSGKEARVVVDPLTPLFWEVKDIALQRTMLENLFILLRSLGTTIVTIEKYGNINLLELSEDLAMPLYLGDAVILISLIFNQNFYQTAISVLKMRFSQHSSGLHPFEITSSGIHIFQDQPIFEIWK